MGHWRTALTAALALANIAGPRTVGGRPYAPPAGDDAVAALGEVLQLTIADPPPLDGEDVEMLMATGRSLWTALHAAGIGDLDAAVPVLNRVLEETAARPHLTRHQGHPWHLHFADTRAGAGRRWASDLAAATAILAGSQEVDRLRVCAAPACDQVLLDTTRSRTRRFCTTACQNRVKAGAHRARTLSHE